jgi:hypothetical protein
MTRARGTCHDLTSAEIARVEHAALVYRDAERHYLAVKDARDRMFRELYDGGARVADLARVFGITRQRISQLVQGRAS